MKLVLQNGYPSPWPEMPDYDERFALAAPSVTLEIDGVVHFEWKHTITVEFKDRESYKAAKQTTGWQPWDSGLVLVAPSSAEEGYEHPAILADVPYEEHPRTAYCGFMLLGD